MFKTTTLLAAVLGLIALPQAMKAENQTPPPDAVKLKEIKAFCLDFNWAGRRGFAKPGTWKDADPEAHVAWHKTMGVNVIQTFCTSSNGWAWYKNGVAPEQPGLKHDFLRKVVKLGHAEGMLVMGYFTIGANTRWGMEHPNLSYDTPSTYHIPYTDAYLAYLSVAIGDAVKTTGIDGFMIDWIWQPRRLSTEGKWIEAEKKLYAQLMGEPFPGEDKLTREQDLEYSRKAIDRCWKTIRKAAKNANPDCIIWLTCNNMNHPHVVNSHMYRQADWLMAEAGNMKHIQQAKSMIGPHTRLITCMAQWNGQDPTKAVPDAVEAGVGLYGFSRPRTGSGIIPLEKIFSKQVSELSGDEQNIAVLARAYHGKSIDAQWVDRKFVEPDNPPPFHIRLKRRGRGFQDTALIANEKDKAIVTITTVYARGRAQLIRTGKTWPSSFAIRLQRRVDEPSAATTFRMANGVVGFSTSLDGTDAVSFGKMEGGLDLGREWREKFSLDEDPASKKPTVPVARGEQFLEIKVPAEITAGNPEILAFEWEKAAEPR